MERLRGENYYEDLETEGPVEEENFFPSRPTSCQSSVRERKHQESPQVLEITLIIVLLIVYSWCTNQRISPLQLSQLSQL